MLDIGVMITIVMALSEIAKKAGIVTSKFIPLFNILMGIILCVSYKGYDLKYCTLMGISIGFFSSGFYSSCKNIFQGCSSLKKQNK